MTDRSILLLQLETSSRFRKWVKSLPISDQRKVLEALSEAQKAVGTPHSHKGVGIRKLRGSVMECRAGLHLRMIFICDTNKMTFVAGGNHDDIRRFLKTV